MFFYFVKIIKFYNNNYKKMFIILKNVYRSNKNNIKIFIYILIKKF